jgi:transposase
MRDVSEPLELKEEEVRRDLERIREALGEEVYERFSGIVETLLFLKRLLERKKLTIKRLRRIIFGSSSEKTKDVLPDAPGRGDAEAEDDGAEPKKPKKKRKGGRGRNGAADYPGAEKIEVEHECLSPGDACPKECCKGRLYRQKPVRLVRFSAEPPVSVRIVELEKLRCNLCGEIFTAAAPPEAGEEKYDADVASMIALLHYGSGLPFNRLAGLQSALGVPLPAATQWKLVEELAETLEPVYEELIRQAAQGDVVHNDDTSMKILEFMKEDEEKRRRGEGGEVEDSG